MSDFLQRLPQEGAEATERTVVLLMYTPTDLLVGVRFLDGRPEGLVATVMRRDNFDLTQNDQFAMAIDSYNDGRNGYWFSTNPLGVRVDAQFFEEGEVWIGEWNGVWECASRTEPGGWASEIRIPFSTLRFRPGPQNVMGINLFRRIVRTNEQLFSPLIPLSHAQGTPNVSIARKYVFAGIAGGHDIRVRPYLLGRQDWIGGGLAGPIAHTPDHGKVGLDATYGLTPALAASVTLNTDFALTELDDRQINLTRFDLFYPEKRDFFLENGGLFQFGLPQQVDVFFSRRIGLSEGPEGEAMEGPIRVGGKLTGRAGSVELGLLDVRTGGGDGGAPENFLAARAKYGFGRRSYAGAIATHKLVDGRFENAALGADATVYLKGDVGLSGFAAATRGDSGSDWPSTWNLTLFKRGEQRAFKAAVTDIDARFDPAMGFLLRGGVRKLDGELVIPWYVEGRRIRRVSGAYAGSHVAAHAGGTDSWGHTLTARLDFQSDDSLKLYGGPVFDEIRRPFTIFRDRTVPAGCYRASLAGLAFTSKPGRRLGAETVLEAAGLFGGTRRTVSSRFQWKASRRVTTGIDYSSSWVELPTTSFRAEVVQARVDAAWSTHLSGRALLQYDNATEDLGLNIRVNYLLREGTELALVYGRRDDGSSAALGHPLRSVDEVALLKLTWLFSF